MMKNLKFNLNDDVTTILLGVIIPSLYGLATDFSRSDGELITQNGKIVGFALIGHRFSSPRYFVHAFRRGKWLRCRNSGGSNWTRTRC